MQQGSNGLSMCRRVFKFENDIPRMSAGLLAKVGRVEQGSITPTQDEESSCQLVAVLTQQHKGILLEGGHKQKEGINKQCMLAHHYCCHGSKPCKPGWRPVN
jgi:hypothetical protein